MAVRESAVLWHPKHVVWCMKELLGSRFGLPLKPIGREMTYILFQYKAGGAAIADLRIEVRAANYSPVHFALTRPERDIASRHPDQHLFHICN